MGDLFHPDVQPIWLSMIFNVIRECPQHTFMVLTKRPEIALEHLGNAMLQPYFGLPNLWIGVTAENQQRADERIPILLQTPAAVRFISIEPCLGPVDLSYYLPKNPKKNCPENILPYYNSHGLNWVICGSETGPLARPMKEEWVKNIKDQCVGADVPFFYKQKIVNGQKVALPELEGKQWAEFPEVKP
jgi:protein gp37